MPTTRRHRDLQSRGSTASRLLMDRIAGGGELVPSILPGYEPRGSALLHCDLKYSGGRERHSGGMAAELRLSVVFSDLLVTIVFTAAAFVFVPRTFLTLGVGGFLQPAGHSADPDRR